MRTLLALIALLALGSTAQAQVRCSELVIGKYQHPAMTVVVESSSHHRRFAPRQAEWVLKVWHDKDESEKDVYVSRTTYFETGVGYCRKYDFE